MGSLTVFQGSPWIYSLLFLWLVKLSTQTSTNEIDNNLQELKNLILGRIDDIIIGKLDDMKDQLSDMDTRLKRMDNTIENDIKGKIHNIESEVKTLGIEIISQGAAIMEEIRVAKVDCSSSTLLLFHSLSSRSIETLEEIKTMKQEGKLFGAAINNITLRSNEIKLQGRAIIEEMNIIKEDGFSSSSILNTLDKTLNKSAMIINKIAEERTLLTINPLEITLAVGDEGELNCGVVGLYNLCQWEHSGLIYQLTDVINGSHSEMKASSDSNSNQCGIIIKTVRRKHEGVWTCKVLTTGQTLTASKSVIITGCPHGFFMSNGSKQCFKIFKDKTRNWQDAKAKCEEQGRRLAEPTDAVALALRKDLLDTYGSARVWLGARPDGSKYVWESDQTELRANNTLWYPGHPAGDGRLSTSHCLAMRAQASYLRDYPEQPYWSFNSCSVGTDLYALCEVVIQ